MNSKILNYVLSAIILVLGFLLFQNGCQKKNDCNYERYDKTINIQVQELDSLISENSYLKYKIDSILAVQPKERISIRYKTNYDTITNDSIVFVPVTQTKQKVKTESSYFADSTYRSTVSILYEGQINRVDMLHEVLKYSVNFIPPTKTYVRDNIITKQKEVSRAKLYASIDATFNKFEPKNAYFGLGYKDKHDRIFVASKGLDSPENFKIQYLQPLIKF